MSELAEIREELDHLRSRITSLEYDTDGSHTCDAAAAASVAERHLSYARAECRGQ